MSMPTTYQRGIVLLMVLGFIATISLLTFSGTESQRFLLRKASYVIDAERARDFALLALGTVEKQLLLDGRSSNIDHLNEPWSQNIPMILPEATVWIAIEDVGRYWNLNSIYTAKQGVSETRMTLLEVALENRGQSAEVLKEAVDWMDRNSEITPLGSGREMNDYFAMGLSYGPRNDYMHTVDELFLLPLWQAKDNIEIEDWLTVSASCSDSRININTATRSSLDLFQPLLLSSRDIDFILSERQEQPFESLSSAFERIVYTGDPSKVSPLLSVSSQCFLVSVSSQVNRTKVTLSAEFVREQNSKEEIRIAKAWQRWIY